MNFRNIEFADDLTLDIVKHYMRIDFDLDDFELELYLKSAISYVRKYVEIDNTDEKLDVEMVMPILMLVSHFYENKSPVNVSNEKLDVIFHGLMWMNKGVRV